MRVSSIEDVTAARGAPVWQQLYPTNVWEVGRAIVKRAERAGSPAIVLTVVFKKVAIARRYSVLKMWTRGTAPLVTREDAQIAVAHGVDGLIVSNHGGRAEESFRPTIESLPEVIEGAAGKIPVLEAGGIRRGTDIFRSPEATSRFVLPDGLKAPTSSSSVSGGTQTSVCADAN